MRVSPVRARADWLRPAYPDRTTGNPCVAKARAVPRRTCPSSGARFHRSQFFLRDRNPRPATRSSMNSRAVFDRQPALRPSPSFRRNPETASRMRPRSHRDCRAPAHALRGRDFASRDCRPSRPCRTIHLRLCRTCPRAIRRSASTRCHGNRSIRRPIRA